MHLTPDSYTLRHMLARDATLCIIVGAYFLSNSLRSTDRKYTSHTIQLYHPHMQPKPPPPLCCATTEGWPILMTIGRAHKEGVYRLRKEYSPRLLETSSLVWTSSFTYPSLAFSDFHLPCLLKSLSGTFALAAAVAPPALKL